MNPIEKDFIAQLVNIPTDYYLIGDLIRTEHFTEPKARVMYGIISELHKNSIPIDQISLWDYANRKNLPITISDITSFEGACNISFAANAINIQYMIRELKKYGAKLNMMPDNSDPLEVIQEAESKIFDITQSCYKKSFVELKYINEETQKLLEAIKKRGVNEFVMPTGFLDIDNLLGGFKKTELIIVAGRPSMGKTSLALNIARNISLNKPVGFFSLEMSNMQLSARMISMESGVPVDHLLTGKFTEDQEASIARAIMRNNLPIYIDDTSSLNIFELKSKAKRMKIEKGVSIIFVDYLQLCTTERGLPREQQISMISATLKQIAKELNIPVVALSQMNRSVETRTTKKPQLSDLRESGAIEQDADMVMFVHRPEVYDIRQLEDTTSTENLAQVIVGKNRNGSIGEINLAFIKQQTKFENLSKRNEK